MSVFILSLWPTQGAGATQPEQHYWFDIPEQPLQFSLRELARVTGLQIARFSDSSERTKNTNAVRGEYSAAQALETLLQGTGLTFRFINERTVAIVRARAAPTHEAGVHTNAPAEHRESVKQGWLSRLAAVLAACGPILSPHLACAQDTSASTPQNTLEEVIVTARKREENIQNVPVAITALSAEALRENAIQTLEDVRFHAPGLQVSPSPFGSAVPGISIRGQRQLDAIITLDPAVGIYFADVVWERPHGANASMYDLQSIQVLKGPQGTLFGRNTTGGAVLISPNKPSFDGVGGYLNLALGNYDSRKYGAMLNLPVSETLAVRFAAQLNQHSGYTHNLFDGSRKDDADDQSYRASITFKPTENVESTTVYQFFKENTAGNGWRLGGVNPAGQIGNPLVGGGANVVSALQNTLALSAHGRNVINDQLLGSSLRMHHASNTTAWTVGSVTLKNILGWHQVDSSTAFDFDGSAVELNRTAAAADGLPQAPVTLFNSRNSLRVHQWTEEFQVLGKAFDEHLDWIAGLYYFRERGPDVQFSDLFGRRINDGTGENRSKSIFAQGTYKLPWLEALSVTVGARQTWDDREIEQHQKLMSLDGTQYVCRLTEVSGPLNPCDRHRTYDDDAPTWGVTLDYALSEDSMVYLARRRGYKSGGLQLRANSYLEPATFNPEFVDDWELGIKSTVALGSVPMRINAAVYHQDYKDIQRTVSVLVPGSTSQLVSTALNAAKAKIQGAELELTVKPFNSVELSAFANFTDANYDEFSQSVSGGGTADLSDSDFSMIPQHVFGGSLRYALPLPATVGNVSIRGNWYQQSHMELSDISVVNGVRTGEGQLPPYQVADAFLDWNQALGQPLDVRLYVRNLTDKTYGTGGFSVISTGFYVYTLGAPRTYGLELRYWFGSEK